MANLKTIQDFKTKLAGGGARSNLFEVEIATLPTGAGATWSADDLKFLCKAAALPASFVSAINVPFRNRALKVAGQRSFDPWTITIINDENFNIRTAFEQWVNLIDKLSNASGATNPSAYMVDIKVHQLGKGLEQGSQSTTNSSAIGNSQFTPLRSYTLYSAFPTNISPIDLSYDTADQIEEFSVEFQYQYFTVGTDTDRNGTRIE